MKKFLILMSFILCFFCASNNIALSVQQSRLVLVIGNFIAYDDGTVLDTKTNLMWAVKDNGSDINWNNAKKYCENYRVGGYSDWRLPTQDELENLYKSGIRDDKGIIKITDWGCWASETRNGGFEAAYFYFHRGRRHWRSVFYDYYVRVLPVRGGQN
ncbi:MAG: DUF1566 domain-containing protein [Desulfobacterales bacterium]|nr:DUF1566 domain-containing protein [Desulfobacterales bacterium]